MKSKLVVSLFALTLVGCAHFQTKQYDERYNDKGEKTTAVITKASAYTFFSSASQLQNFKASQSEKTQRADVGSLTQQTEASTNVAHIVEAVINAAVKAAMGK